MSSGSKTFVVIQTECLDSLIVITITVAAPCGAAKHKRSNNNCNSDTHLTRSCTFYFTIFKQEMLSIKLLLAMLILKCENHTTARSFMHKNVVYEVKALKNYFHSCFCCGVASAGRKDEQMDNSI
jgi:hypothetical protein